MTVRLAITIIGIALFGGACQPQQNTSTPSNTAKAGTAATPDQFANARTLYIKDCQNCHGAKGEGGPVTTQDGTKLKVPSLREGHALRHADSEFLKQITKGGDGMPAFENKLTPDQMNELIRFIRHEYQGGMTPPAEKMPMKKM